jgi:cytochrome c biogenesis protein
MSSADLRTTTADAASPLDDDAARLSTAPTAPRQGPRRSPLLVAWRQLTSMRTALLLLALLGLAAIPGSLLPQRGLNPVKVDQFLANHPHLGPFLDRLSFFDVFAAPWFAAIYLLLFVSLVGCLFPRIRLHARALRRRPPRAPRHLDRLAISDDWTDAAEPAAVVERARALLRSGRWRVDVTTEADGAVSLGAEKGYLRETGNLVFHVSLVVLLAGIALGGLFGYKGTVLVVQGDSFANQRASYDIFQPSRLYGDDQLAPFSFTLDHFAAVYQPNGEPRSFDARVGYRSAPTVPATSHDISVNHPLSAAGAKVYLVGHGYALHVQVRAPDGTLVYDRATPFLPDDSMFASHGVVKVPDGLRSQLGLAGFFYPSFTTDAVSGPHSSYPGLGNPVVDFAAFRGNLGLDNGIPQSVYSLPVGSPDLHPVRSARTGLPAHRFLRPGQSWRLPDGTTVTFAGVTPWATFQITHDPGTRVVLVAAVLIVAGLLLSLRVRRRRLWLRAGLDPSAPDDPRTLVRAAALARSDNDEMAREFADLVRRMRD